MLELRDIRKAYVTGNFVQQALDGVSVAFRDCEFVSILGQSGSGKTTLLNVIGGLDQFDSGDLIIEGVSTKTYTDRDWDTYRNLRIGFVFQSYNLIPHQTILANVELALTLSGVGPSERRERAIKALADVGLEKHIDKRPNQLSGGQMQRVAIARALINEPDIILADEPTGALDSATSIQVMNLLRDVANERLVIMVTHNPELARQYSTRIVELQDGKLLSDTNPFELKGTYVRDPKPLRHTSMGFFTALSLSFNNLMTKKGRTLMTAFAGSIGIIGIAAILALANGVNAYIAEVEAETLSVYPLQITSSGFDLTSFLVDVTEEDESSGGSTGAKDNLVKERRMVTNMFNSVGSNDLTALKAYFDEGTSGLANYVQDIEYEYNLTPHIFVACDDGTYRQVNPDSNFSSMSGGISSFGGSASSNNSFQVMPKDPSIFQYQYDVLAGSWPKGENELALILSRSGTISDVLTYAMGLRDPDELKRMVEQFMNKETVEVPEDTLSFTYDQLMGVRFKVVPAYQFYVKDETYNVWTSKSDDAAFMDDLVSNARELKVSCIVRPKESVDSITLGQGLYYTDALVHALMEEASASEIVQDQLKEPTINVFSGKSFEEEASGQGGDVDLSSMFTIDEGKIASALSMSPENMDFSGMDLSSMDFSAVTDALTASMDPTQILSSIDVSTLNLPVVDLSSIELPEIYPEDLIVDFSELDTTDIDLTSAMTPELSDLMAGNLTFDIDRLLEGVSAEEMVNTDELVVPLAEVQAGLSSYIEASGVPATDVDGTRLVIESYYSQPWVRDRLSQAARSAVDFTAGMRERLGQNITSQVDENFQGATQGDLSHETRLLAGRLRDTIADQLSVKLTNLLSSELVATVADTLGVALEAVMSISVSDVIAGAMQSVEESFSASMTSAMGAMMGEMMKSVASSYQIDEQAFADAFAFSMDQKQLVSLLSALMSNEPTSYDANLVKLGYVDEETPSEIDIYPKSFEDKAAVVKILDNYNDQKRESGQEGQVITYTDFVGVLMSSVTEIVNMISYVLIAFVGISLVVSSIMIGVITYVSVLERKKEIGILRAIGTSKGDVILVFIAETVIEGFVSGTMGVGITFLLTIPVNIIVEANFDVERVARLPIGAAIILVAVSIFLSFIAGLMPARAAAREDPVEALRSD